MQIIEIEKISGIERSSLSRMKNGRRKRIGVDLAKQINSFTGTDIGELVSMDVKKIFEIIKKTAEKEGET